MVVSGVAPIRWEQARKYLPFDLDGLARETGALRRLRGVSSAEDLLRVLLMCALPGASFERVSDWVRESGLGTMSAAAVFFRLRDGERWLEAVLGEVLSLAAPRAPCWSGLRLLAVDATVLCGPGSQGTDQRLHVVYDLSSWMPVSVEATDAHGGESLSRHACWGPGDLVLADRGYGHARGIRSALDRGASLLVRFEFASIRLVDAQGRRIEPSQEESQLAEMPVWLDGDGRALRAIGTRTPGGRTVWLLTDLDAQTLPAEQARELYRARWQIELFFKRMKTLLRLDRLPSRDGPSARPWILAKLILAALAVLVRDEAFSPWASPQRVEGVRQGRLDAPRRPPGRQAEASPQTAKTPAKTTAPIRLLEG